MKRLKEGLSLVELLVALGILAIVAAIIVPRFLNVQQQAQDTVAQQMASELNRVYAHWVASGGSAGNNVATADLLKVLSGASNTAGTEGTDSWVANGGNSASIQTTLPASAQLADGSQVVDTGTMLIIFQNTDRQFITFSKDASGNLVDPVTGQALIPQNTYTNNYGGLITYNGVVQTVMANPVNGIAACQSYTPPSTYVFRIIYPIPTMTLAQGIQLFRTPQNYSAYAYENGKLHKLDATVLSGSGVTITTTEY